MSSIEKQLENFYQRLMEQEQNVKLGTSTSQVENLTTQVAEISVKLGTLTSEVRTLTTQVAEQNRTLAKQSNTLQFSHYGRFKC